MADSRVSSSICAARRTSYMGTRDFPTRQSYVEQRWNVEFLEQAGSGYIFTNDKAHLVVSSEIYWGRYKLWFVPTATLEAS